jgi:hypothetical protein
MYRVNSNFDALEGDDGKIGAFADDCVRHENGYQTVNNPPPGGRGRPSPDLRDPSTPQGKEALRFSMLTCSQQISEKVRLHEAHPPAPRADLRRAETDRRRIPLFIHDGTRRGAPPLPECCKTW